jgi:glutathione synthase
MHILVIADPLHSFKIYKDTSYAILRALAARGHTVWACEQKDMFANPTVQAQAQQLSGAVRHP